MTNTGLLRSRRRWRMVGTAMAAVVLLAAGVLLGRLVWPTSSANTLPAAKPTAATLAPGNATALPTTFVSPVGPTSVKNGIPTGYAHSTQGAMAAAVNWLILSTLPPADISGDRISVLAVNATAAAEKFVGGDPAGGGTLIPCAVGTDAVGSDDVTVVVIHVKADPAVASPAAVKTTLRADWDGEDWRLRNATGSVLLGEQFQAGVAKYGLHLKGYFILFPTQG